MDRRTFLATIAGGLLAAPLAAEARAEGLERALRSWAKSQEEPAGELCWCSEGEALSAMSPADRATACDALRPAKETT